MKAENKKIPKAKRSMTIDKQILEMAEYHAWQERTTVSALVETFLDKYNKMKSGENQSKDNPTH